MLLRPTALAFAAALLAAALPATAPSAHADAPAFDDGSWLPAAGGARVLVHPFAGAATLHVLDGADELLVIGTSGDFLRARLADGRIGWILPRALAAAESIALRGGGDLLPEPSDRATPIVAIPAGQRVLVLERDGRWGRVVTERGDVGWLVLGGTAPTAARATRMTADPTAQRAAAGATTSGAAWLAVVATDAQLRSTASLDSDVVGTVRSGTRVSVVSERGAWVRVVAPTASGWLPRHFLALDEETPPTDAVMPAEPVAPVRAIRARPTRPSAPAVAVDESEEGWVHLASSVRLYEQPSWQAFSHVFVREYRTLRALRARGAWLLLRTSHGETGWAHRDALAPALEPGTPMPEPPPEPEPFEQSFRVVDVDVRGQGPSAEARLVDMVEVSVPLTVRVGPSSDATPVVGLLPGDQITVLDHLDGWTRVALPRERTGWVPSPLLGLPAEAPIVATPAEMRPAPTPGAAERRGEGGRGDMDSRWMERTDDPSRANPPAARMTARRELVLPSSSTLHPEPSRASGELEVVPGGARVHVADSRDGWLRVETETARRGWIDARDLGGRLHVLREPVVARRSPAWGARILDDLDEGELVVVRQSFGAWLEIRLPGRSGWIPAAAATPRR